VTDSSSEITFVLFSFNEEKRIERAIKNFMGFGRVLIVDNESTDGTVVIAKSYGCEILINKNPGWVEDEVTTARVKAAVGTNWIYWGFADEMVDKNTLEAIVAAVRSGGYDIVNIARKNYYYGEFCNDLFVDRMNRIFRKDSIDFSGNLLHHFGTVVAGSKILELPLKYFVHHFISNTAKSYLHVIDRYTDMESHEARVMPSIARLCASSVKMVVSNLFLRKGYKTGIPSIFLVCNMVFYRWFAAMKLYEQRCLLNRDAIEEKNDAIRDRILASLR